MNSKFTGVTLNSFIFVRYSFCTNHARKFRIINITHEVSLFTALLDLANEILYVTKLIFTEEDLALLKTNMQNVLGERFSV